MPRPRLPLGTAGEMWVVELDDGRFKARVMLRTMTGKRRQLERIGTTPTKAKTALKLAVQQYQASTPGATLSGRTRLQALIEQHLEDLENQDRSPSTIAEYKRVTEKHLDALRDLRLDEADAGVLWQYLDALRAEHGTGTAKTVRSVLSGAFTRAVKAKAIKTNPIREIRFDSALRTKPGSDALPLDELPGILEKVRAHPVLRELDLVDVLLVMAGTGLRVGEACALRWQDYDEKAKTITVSGTNRREKGVGIVRQGFTKSEAGARTIVVPEFVTDVLNSREKRGDMMFAAVNGGLLDGVFVGAKIAAVRDDLGAPGMTSHSFRKTVATALDAAGFSARAIADYLGHAHPSMTQDRYLSRGLDTAPAALALDRRFA